MNVELLTSTTAPEPSSEEELRAAQRREAVERLLALPMPPGPEPDWAEIKEEMLDSFGAVAP